MLFGYAVPGLSRHALALAALVALSGCAATGAVEKPVAVEADPVNLRLVEAADRAVKAQETLASVEQASRSAAGATAPPVANPPEELRQLITVTWTGPIEQLSAKLAERAGYAFNAIGPKPPTPIIVDIDAIDKPLIELFRDLGLQAGFRADLAVDGQRRTVEIRYAPVVNQ